MNIIKVSMKISGGWEKHKGLIFIIAVFIITRIVVIAQPPEAPDSMR